MMTEIGKVNRLAILKERNAGIYLDGGELGEILLPNRDVPQDFELDDMIDVFIYRDSEDRLIATTATPVAQVGEFALLRCTSTTDYGAFLYWGLAKDLLVPFREQAVRMERGRSYIVYIYLDATSQRLVASSKLNKHLERIAMDETAEPFQKDDLVSIMISAKTDMGYKAIIENRAQGILFANEVFRPLKRGEKLEAYIKNIRKDGKIDLVLQKPTYQILDQISQDILARLDANNGYLDITDKSSPEVISSLFGISKKSFKKGLGTLYRKRLITIQETGIYRINPKDNAE
ncbi:MAG: GntR family transcriptional regulator [Candidatus Cloacimonetes bacterium]|nr:GntR family transcriptional regulator [Candidatus Cloacimonadota bacterium]